MTLNECISIFDEIRPNAYSNGQKAGWLSELDGRLQLEPIGSEEPWVAYRYPEDGDKQLLVESPYDNLYLLYLCTMAAFHAQDYVGYANNMVLFNEALDQYRKQVRRTERPKWSGYRNV